MSSDVEGYNIYSKNKIIFLHIIRILHLDMQTSQNTPVSPIVLFYFLCFSMTL